MRAGVLWMVMVCLSGGKVTGCSVETIITVSKLSNVSVSCPSVTADSTELKYLLHLNDSYISQIHLQKQAGSAKSLFSGRFDVKASDSGVYTCKREVIYPPPFREDCHTTIVIVAEKQSAINDTVPAATGQSSPGGSPLITQVVMWAGCGVLLVYSLSITCITIVIWRKQKKDDKEDDTNVYYNTRPGEFKKPYKA